MGFWEKLYNITPKFLTGNPADNNNNHTKQHPSLLQPETQIVVTTTGQRQFPYSPTALIKLTATLATARANNLVSYFPDLDRREKITGAVTNFGKQTVTYGWQIPYNIGLAAALKANQAFRHESVQNLKYYLPEPDRREKITGAVTNFGKQTVTYGWQIPYNIGLAAALKANQAFPHESVQNLKYYLPEPDRREKIARIATNIGKLAVDSAINDSLKGITGGVQVYKIVMEGLKGESSSLSSGNEKTKAEMATIKAMEAKVKKMEEELNTIKAKLEQQHYTSHKTEDFVSAEQDTT